MTTLNAVRVRFCLAKQGHDWVVWLSREDGKAVRLEKFNDKAFACIYLRWCRHVIDPIPSLHNHVEVAPVRPGCITGHTIVVNLRLGLGTRHDDQQRSVHELHRFTSPTAARRFAMTVGDVLDCSVSDCCDLTNVEYLRPRDAKEQQKAKKTLAFESTKLAATRA